ncbi:MAG: hypothetical protein K2J15_02820 [Muribaculaceae bacterium]|nr:hypothetical protein [Muribaculaceae bacterium]
MPLNIIRNTVFFITAMVILGGGSAIQAKKNTLRLSAPKSAKKEQSDICSYLTADSLTTVNIGAMIEFSGFDKPYNSRKETFLITNHSQRYLAGVVVRIEYFDSHKRMINAREEEIIKPVPPGETRFVTIKSFDPQSTLYYHRSRPPRNGGGQPFTVGISLVRVLLPK